MIGSAIMGETGVNGRGLAMKLVDWLVSRRVDTHTHTHTHTVVDQDQN